MKQLIVNADDFGYTHGVNQGIIDGFRNGIITSTSLMVNRPETKHAARLAKENPELGIGFHFELIIAGEALREIRKIAYLNQAEEIGKKIMTLAMIKNAKKQFYEQIDLFKKLVGEMPDHIDGHHHVHKFPSLLPTILEFSKKHKIPLRAVGEVNFIDSFSGTDDPKDTSPENLIKILRNLPDGVSELMTHPGYFSGELRKESSMSDIREIELKILTSPGIKKVVKEEGIELISWESVKMI